MFTDGMPTDDMEYAKRRLTEQEKKKKLNFFAIGLRKSVVLVF